MRCNERGDASDYSQRRRVVDVAVSLMVLGAILMWFGQPGNFAIAVAKQQGFGEVQFALEDWLRRPGGGDACAQGEADAGATGRGRSGGERKEGGEDVSLFWYR